MHGIAVVAAADKFHGWGRRWQPDGTVMDGYWVYGVQMGIGRQRLPQRPGGFATYRGDIRSGAWTGKGRLEQCDGTIYEGTFAGGKKYVSGQRTGLQQAPKHPHTILLHLWSCRGACP